MSNHEQRPVDWERAEQAASIAAIPLEQLPDESRHMMVDTCGQ